MTMTKRAWLSQSVRAQVFKGSGDQDNEGFGLIASPSQHLYHYHILDLLCCHPVQAYNPPTSSCLKTMLINVILIQISKLSFYDNRICWFFVSP